MATWNYRVIEFVTPSSEGAPEERWRAIHEVHYDENGRPSSYTESPARVAWDVDDGDSAPLFILERMKRALAKPVLLERDFHSQQSCVDNPGTTQNPK